jgi:hypothetical protein
MKITRAFGRDFGCPLGGAMLAIIGIVYAVCGLFFLVIRQICKPAFFLFVSVILLTVSINLFSIGNAEQSGQIAEIALAIIGCYGVSLVIESMIERRRRKRMSAERTRDNDTQELDE